jgi:hypothetical protein
MFYWVNDSMALPVVSWGDEKNKNPPDAGADG